MRSTTLGAILWIGCLQYFAAEAIAISDWRGSYSLRENFISDLAAAHCGLDACSPLHPVMNASFLLQGLLIFLGAALTRPLFPARWPFVLALGPIAASGLGVFVVGLAPEDVATGWHYFGAAENFLFCNSGAALLGIALLPSARTLGLVSLAAGLAGLFGLAGIATQTYFGLGVGGIERVTAYPFPVWIACMGAWLLSGRRAGATGS